MWEVFKKIWAFSPEETPNLKKSMGIGFLNAMFNALLILAVYLVLKAITEDAVTMETAGMSLGVMVASIVGKIVTQYYSQLQRTHAGYFMARDKRLSIGQKLKSVPMGYFNKNSLGRITAIGTTILNDVEGAVPVVLIITLGGFLNTLVFALFLCFFDLRIAAIAILGIILFLLVTASMEKKSRTDAPKRQQAQEDLVEKVLEAIQGMPVIKAFHLKEGDHRRVDTAISESRVKNEAMEKSMTPYVFAQQVVLYAASVVMIYASIRFYLGGSMEISKCIMSIICAFVIFEQLKVAGGAVANLRIAETSMDRANAIDDVPVLSEGTVAQAPDHFDIQFNHVHFSYGETEVLKDINITIPEKKLTAIVGPSGSGKTTLTSLIPRFWDPDSGSITLGGIDLKDYTVETLMANISVVFQNTYLFCDTVENNIRFGKPGATREEVVEAAKKACCHEFIQNLPEGYDTLVGEGGATLSGGERQRIAIARAMIKDASVIIFDEATASVDPENEDRLQMAMEALTENKTVILIAHRLKTVRHADQIIVLDKGQVVQQGTHEELAGEEGIYARFLAGRREAVGWKLGRKVADS